MVVELENKLVVELEIKMVVVELEIKLERRCTHVSRMVRSAQHEGGVEGGQGQELLREAESAERGPPQDPSRGGPV